MQRILIIGGSDAGISAALRAKEVDPQVGVTVIVADQFPNFSICGLPFYLSGEVQDWKMLATELQKILKRKGFNCCSNIPPPPLIQSKNR